MTRRVVAGAFVSLFAVLAFTGPHHHAEDDAGPVCFAEPSATPEGVEIIEYPHLWQHDNLRGVEVACP